MGMDVSGNNPKFNKTIDEFPTLFKWKNKGWDERKGKKWEKDSDKYWSEDDKYNEANPGIYFRNNCWWWRPLWDFCHHIAPELINEEIHSSGHYNDGEGLDSDDAAKLGVKLMTTIEDGTAEHYQKEVELINEQKEADGNKFTYPFSVENVERFAKFCLESGGFSIH